MSAASAIASRRRATPALRIARARRHVAPEATVLINGDTYKITLLGSRPRRLPPSALVLESRETGHYFRLAPVLRPEATAPDFDEVFSAAVAEVAALRAAIAAREVDEGRWGPGYAAPMIASCTRLVVEGGLRAGGSPVEPEGAFAPKGVADPLQEALSEARSYLHHLTKDRGRALGGFTEEEHRRLVALAGSVAGHRLDRFLADCSRHA